MSMTQEEYAEDQYMAELYEEHKKEAIEEFTDERLCSYYLANRLLAKPAIEALHEARGLITSNARAGLIFAAISMEVGLKTTLLKPIVHGLVHTESVATLITDLTVSRTDMKKYRKLLMQVLQDHGGVNLNSLRRVGSKRTLWEEIRQVQDTRNRVMHRAELASDADADLALGVASEILETIFPAVITKMGLHLHDGFRICNDWECRYLSRSKS